jgi:hypothetical protein
MARGKEAEREGGKQRGEECGVMEKGSLSGVGVVFMAISTYLPVPAVNEWGREWGNLTKPTLGPWLPASITGI